MDYEMKYPEGRRRPRNLMFNEFVIGDMFTKVLIRRKEEKKDMANVQS